MTLERGKLIELIGPTCGGKTTFATELGVNLGAVVLLETTEGNPHMADAHQKGDRSWDNQVWFLKQYVERLTQAAQLVKDGKIAVVDSGLTTYLLHSQLILTPDQNVRFRDSAARLVQHLPLPDLIIYLWDDTDFLMERLKKRNLPCDDTSAKFVADLTQLHDTWVAQTQTPVIPIRSRDLEYEGLKADIIRFIRMDISQSAC